mgnify:CR=1 FL=1
MRKKLLLAMTVLLLGLAGTGHYGLTAEASPEEVQDQESAPEDTQGMANSLILQAQKSVDMKSTPEETADTIMTFSEGSLLFATGESEDGWYHIVYQGTEGYVRTEGLEVQELDVVGLDAEMAAQEEETKFVVEAVEKYRSDAKRSRRWGGIIVVLVISIFAVGIVSSVRINKNEEGDRTDDADKKHGVNKTGGMDRKHGAEKKRGASKLEAAERKASASKSEAAERRAGAVKSDDAGRRASASKLDGAERRVSVSKPEAAERRAGMTKPDGTVQRSAARKSGSEGKRKVSELEIEDLN